MTVKSVDVAIIGGGLSGIYAACLLLQKNRSFVILEARDRTGGRVLSPEHQGYFTDLGPSWYWPQINPRIMHLIQVLGLEGYPQYESGMGRFEMPTGEVRTVRGYETNPASWRLKGGMGAMIEKLLQMIPPDAIQLNSPVCEIIKNDKSITIHVGELEKPPWAKIEAQKVILALPPRLAAASILFTPDLPEDLTRAMMRMGTWMACHAKFYALYDEPFWRASGLSGQAFSQKGPLGEIHDGSDPKKGPYGLTGFLNIPAGQRKRESSLTTAMLAQLAAIYGHSAAQPVSFFYQDWARERFTATEYDQPMMQEHPVYQPPAGHTHFWDGRVQFAGSETAAHHGGYLEGALESAHRSVMQL